LTYDTGGESRRSRRLLEERERKRAQRRRVAAWVGVTVLVVFLALGGIFAVKVLGKKKPPPVQTFKVVIPEGFTVNQTAERFEEVTGGRIKASDFIAQAKAYHPYSFLKDSKNGCEGFLFPKTYEVTASTTAAQAVDMMLKQFALETSGLDWSRATALGISPYQAVTVGSMIEREVKLPTERPIVASVIYNRLTKKMRLQICATVEYSLGHWKPALSDADLQVDSPYNTYKIDGLPPGPICSPGFEAIRAALYPDATNYLFYILTSPAEGKHSFTADYAQFAQWKAQLNK